jgi:hypothetical protein
MQGLFEFGFIVLISLGAVVVVPVGLFATGALFDALDHPGDVRSRFEGLFRQPNAAARKPGKDHYYRPYWAGK